VLEILRVRAFPLVKLTRAHDLKAHVQRVQFVVAETHRLLQHPEIFPSSTIRTRFVAIVASDANLQFVQAVKEMLLHDIADNISRHYHSRNRPSFLPGSKGWENFLFHQAPGVPIQGGRVTTTPKSSYQMIPTVGLRIVGDACREEDILSTWIKETVVPLKVEPAATTKILDLDKPNEQLPNPALLLSQQSYDTYSRPNPFREIRRLRFDLGVHGSEAMENFSPFLGRLELPPLPANQPVATLNAPNIFPMVSLRSWHPPTKLSSLRYHRLPLEQPATSR
jgi:hypothetical protein